MPVVFVIGVGAALFTSLSNIPQVRKCWQSGVADDLSLAMLPTLGAGLVLWVGYGLLKDDYFIVAANSFSLACLSVIMLVKLRRRPNPPEVADASPL